MKKNFLLFNILCAISSAALAANPVNPPNFPLETGTANSVKPNIMFVLDDSGSMAWNFLGDELGTNLCKQFDGSNILNFERKCGENGWDAPFASYEVNKIYYNPTVEYKPGVNYNGTSLGNQSLSSARTNIYQTTTTIDLNTGLREPYFCTTSSPTASQLTNSIICRRNGIDHTNGTFNYYTEGYPNATYKYRVEGVMTPGYYKILPTEYCDNTFVTCKTTTTGGLPAPIRWCADSATAISTSLQTGVFPSNYTTRALRGKNKCQKNYDASLGYTYPRYGKFKRENLTAAEGVNFANWYTYYRTRMLTMKTSVGISFQKIDSKTRVGFITINPGDPVSSSKFLQVRSFDSDQKQLFFNKLYGSDSNGGTPLREALSRIGRYYAGKSDGINSGMRTTGNFDPVQYSCQQNFTILSTDGYWNGNGGINLAGSALTNQDNVNAGYSTRASGSFDGNLSGSQETLADVAMYYYKTDLRTSDSVSTNNVPISISDSNASQHMVTYAISFGLNGLLSYTPDYLNGGNTDFENIKSGFLNWPEPEADTSSAIDDLWHATVNGRGKYYSAQNSKDLVTGFNEAINTLISQTGASASAATSSPNITSSENFLYYVTYRTVKWDGEISATTINHLTGEISTTENWSARTKLNEKVGAESDTRTIYYVRNSLGSSSLRAFNEGQMSTSESDEFKNKCYYLRLNQCADLTDTQKALVDTGSDLIKYLRGQRKYELTNSTDPFFRTRDYVLGDIVNSSPVYVSKPSYNWGDGYSTYASANATRSPTLYVGANDGMLHAFNATTGEERWGIIPRQMFGKLYKLADRSYAVDHEFYVDGTVSVMDAKIDNNWRTILITGMNGGGKGYIAVDVTNPDSPVVLWEMCNSSVCSIVDSEIGYTYGNPIITKRKFDNKWVAYLSAGYDNNTGKGLIYEVDLKTGGILRRLYTGTGTAASPSGVSRINAYFDNFNNDNTASFIYAGDLDGKVWKWDLSDSSKTTATLLGQAKDPSGNPQPITTKVELGRISGKTVLFVGTGQFLNTDDYSTTQIQSVYAFEDKDTNYGNFRTNTALVGQTLSSTSITSTSTNYAVDWNVKDGWYFDLTSQVGERVNIDPILALGVLNLATNVPGVSACTAGGNSWMYQINFATGGAADQTSAFIAKKMPVGLIVGQVIVQLGTRGGLKNYVTDASGKVISIAVTTGGSGSTTSGKKHYWKEIYRK